MAIMEIVAGLGSASVYRLEKTWEGLSQAKKEQYEKLKLLVSRADNFKEMRRAVKNCTPPSIPYLG